MPKTPDLSEIAFNCAILLTLHRQPSEYLNISELISLIERSRWLSPEMLGSVPSRSDTRIANRIHRIVTHRCSPKNLILIPSCGEADSREGFPN